MDNLINIFEDYLSREKLLSQTSVFKYIQTLSKFMKEYSQELPTPELVLSFLKSENEQLQPSRSRWNNRLAAMRAYGAFLVGRGLLENNPTKDISRVRIESREPDPLNFDEMIRLLNSFQNLPNFHKTRNELIILILFHCALRVSELVSLNINQVDMEGRLFSAIRRKRGKTISSHFNDMVAEALENYFKERKQLLDPLQHEALILSQRRTRMSVRAIQAMVFKYAKQARIMRPVTPHLLRHSSATQHMTLGTPISVIQGICGHTSTATTERYIHVPAYQRKEAIDRLGEEWKRRQKKRLEDP